MIDQLSSWLQLPIKYLLAILSNFIFSQTANLWKEPNNWCLVLLCDQNSFGRSKMVLVWPNWFGLNHNDLVTTKMNWSGPNVIHFGRKSQFGPDQFILVVTISFWSRTNHYGQVQINLVRRKPFWNDQNCFGQIEGQGIRSYWQVRFIVITQKLIN